MKKLVLILSILFATVVYAGHEEGLRDGEVYIQQLPALCGSPENIQKYLDHKKLKPLHISLGREAMDPTGLPVYMMTYMVNDNKTERKELDGEGNIITSEDGGAIPPTSTNLKHIEVCFEGVNQIRLLLNLTGV